MTATLPRPGPWTSTGRDLEKPFGSAWISSEVYGPTQAQLRYEHVDTAFIACSVSGRVAERGADLCWVTSAV